MAVDSHTDTHDRGKDVGGGVSYSHWLDSLGCGKEEVLFNLIPARKILYYRPGRPRTAIVEWMVGLLMAED